MASPFDKLFNPQSAQPTQPASIPASSPSEYTPNFGGARAVMPEPGCAYPRQWLFINQSKHQARKLADPLAPRPGEAYYAKNTWVPLAETVLFEAATPNSIDNGRRVARVRFIGERQQWCFELRHFFSVRGKDIEQVCELHEAMAAFEAHTGLRLAPVSVAEAGRGVVTYYPGRVQAEAASDAETKDATAESESGPESTIESTDI